MIVDLFSGVGGWSYGALIAERVFNAQGFYPTVSVEIDDFAHSLSVNRGFRVRDIQTYSPVAEDSGKILYCSFPCTGTSIAGKRQGLSHPESALFFHAMRIIKILQPRWVIIENPRGLVYNGLEEVLGELHDTVYQTAVVELTARMFYLPHRRPRVYIVAHSSNVCGRLFREKGWSDKFRGSVEKVRAYSRWLQAKLGLCQEDDGVFTHSLKFHDMAQLPGNKQRVDIISAYARAVVPFNAATIIGFVNACELEDAGF